MLDWIPDFDINVKKGHIILYVAITVIAVYGSKLVYDAGYKSGWLDSFHIHEKHIVWPESDDYK